ncbi:hypothetical protein L2E82_41453 [Cichorium intybus]|uniref:Uncharacterized protein n=1 Tax=Cichorium intybus TaxID=13427 RepID=A0ACB9AP33_CICIN|nr:hypothetical protein L2E82_41453 [Cichorium intybus]
MKRYQSESSDGKEKDEDITTTRAEEITLLEGIIDFYNENGKYPFADLSSEGKFSKDLSEEPEFYANALKLQLKMLQLHARVLVNEAVRIDDNIDAVAEMVEIWGEKDDEDHNNSAEEKTVDDHGGVLPNKVSGDSYEQESGDDRCDKKDTDQDSGDDHGDKKDSKDLKDLTEQVSDIESDTKDSSDSSSKDSSEGKTGNEGDTEDSTSSSAATSDGSVTKDSKDSSSKDSSEGETDDGRDTEHSSSVGSNDPSETETGDDHDGTDHSDRLDSKDLSSICLEENLNAQLEQRTQNQQAVPHSTTSWIRAGFGIVIVIIMALIIATKDIRYQKD